MNRFGDLLHEEFNSMMNGHRPELMMRKNKTGNNTILFSSYNHDQSRWGLPEAKDWRKEGHVTPVKDQGNCGSCWAFSATGALEGQYKATGGKLTSLSEQNLIDCTLGKGNAGCSGGSMDNAFMYVKLSRGIDTEAGYPYEGVDNVEGCRFQREDVAAFDSGYVDLPSEDEEALKIAVATVGPISVAIDASRSMKFYDSGVYYDKDCSSSIWSLNHGVLVVGYGSDEEDGNDYFIVKNSWGELWGEGGYIRMSRNMDNNCGIATMASYPIV